MFLAQGHDISGIYSVKQVAENLKTLGYVLPEKWSGKFDEYITATVIDFQRRKKLTVDGVIGNCTWAMLESSLKTKWNLGGFDPIEVHPIMVPYLSQRDNKHKPWGTCNVTCLAMVLEYFGVKPIFPNGQLEDELYEEIYSKEGKKFFEMYKRRYPQYSFSGINAETVHPVLAWISKNRGIKDRFIFNGSVTLIKEQLFIGWPVILTGAFTGSGHIVLAIGLTKGHDLIVHDPWGNWLRGYTNHDGAFLVYPIEKLKPVLKENPEGKIWMHQFYD